MTDKLPRVVTVERTELREVTHNAIGLIFHVKDHESASDVLFGFPASQVHELNHILAGVIDDWGSNSAQ